ncbi:MAG: InlB B-repeat-containing protein [Clostridiales bacterium]|nr:InlB B-repeat-containing protein [Clostridiales bacterium]
MTNIFSSSSGDHGPYIFKFEVTIPEENKTFHVPTQGKVGGNFNDYNWNIDWGDGQKENFLGKKKDNSENSGIEHIYKETKKYIITLTPFNTEENGWLRAFGYYGDIDNRNINNVNSNPMKDKVTKIISRIYPEMTRKNGEDTPSREWSITFFRCRNIIMGEEFTFDEEAWKNVKSVEDKFAYCMFQGCDGSNFTMNNVFNFPQNLTSVGDDFACCMFWGCSGDSFTMNDIFNFPQSEKLESAMDSFANSMFDGCCGDSFSMNNIFNLPQNLTSVGSHFARDMFCFCNGSNFNMNDIFNLPQSKKLESVGDDFALDMFSNCNGFNFTMNNVFNFPQNLTSVGDGFAGMMFEDCDGDSFTMNKIFNLPQKLSTIKNSTNISYFAYKTFAKCHGDSFAMNDIFNLPQNLTSVGSHFAEDMFLDSGNKYFQINEIFKFAQLDKSSLNKKETLYQSLYLRSSCPPQNRTALTILNVNKIPDKNNKIYTFNDRFRDLDSIPENYGGSHKKREVVFVKNNSKINGIEEIQNFCPKDKDKDERQQAEKLSRQVVELQTFNLQENKFKLPGYKFKSWNTKSDGTGEKYKNKEKIVLDDNLILYAQWSKNSISSNSDKDEDPESIEDKINNNQAEN